MKQNNLETSGESENASIAKKLAVFALLSLAFIAIGTYPPLRAHLRPEALDSTLEGMGWYGPLLLFAIGAFSPLLMLPRWPIAVVSGLVYGVFWGTCLANTASLIGAGLQYWLSRSTLAHAAKRWLTGNRWQHLLESQKHVFSVLFLIRAFPLSNFVATNLLCGTLRIPSSTFFLSTALGMIPSTILYASWGKLTLKPSGGFMSLAFFTLVFIVLGTLFTLRFLARTNASKATEKAAFACIKEKTP